MNFTFPITIKSWPAPWPHHITPNGQRITTPLYSTCYCDVYTQEMKDVPNSWELVIQSPFFRIIFTDKKAIRDALRMLDMATT